MSYNCNFCEKEEQYKSLIFNSGSMNDADETAPDTEQLGNSRISILGWLMPQGDQDEYSLTFSVPKI